MTQNNNQFVRSDAEAALNINRIPTFEEVYAMPYVQESIRAIIDQNVRRYPILASHEDDLRQEILVAIWQELPKFNPAKASLNTYLRLVMHSSINTARREYFSETNISLAYADDIADYEIINDDSTLSKENLQAMAQFAGNLLDMEILRQDVAIVLKGLTAEQRQVAQRIMEGESLRQIARSMGLHHYTMWYRYVLPIRTAFEKIF